MIMSSAQTKRIVGFLSKECLINEVCAPWLCKYVMRPLFFVSLQNQAQGDCLGFYKAFFSVHTLSLSSIDLRLEGICM